MVPDGDEITIRDLLWHQSGLVDVADISGWGTSPSHRPVETLQFAGSMPLTSQPGTTHKYSHTNYVALGLIIEQATGRTYGQQLAQRIVDPYGFASIEMPTTPQLPDLDDTGENPLVAWAAGAIVSNTSDLARFLSALLSGQILPEDFLAEAQEAQPSSDEYHVLGLYALELPCGRYWGLDGYINVYNARVRASGDGSRVAVAIATNPASDLGPVFNSRVCW